MRWAALALTTIIVSGACDTSVHGIALGPLDASPACDPGNIGMGLANIQKNIFDKHCSSSTACHKDDIEDTDHLQLVSGLSWSNLVGVPSKAVYGMPPPMGKNTKQWLRVDPSGGDAAVANSYLMVLIDPHERPPLTNFPVDPDGAGYGSAGDLNPGSGPMPASAGELLCQGQIDVIKAWIMAGAPDD